MNDDEKLRQAFLAVVDAGSYASAAREIGRDASVISRRVSALEEKLGIRLLERSTRRVVATEAGARYYSKVRQALQIINEAEEDAKSMAVAPAGLLRVTLPAAFGRRWLSPLIPDFLKRHPAIQIEIHFTDRYTDIIAEKFDLALRIGRMTDSHMFGRKIAPTRRLLCASPSYIQTVSTIRSPEHLKRVHCLGFSPMATHPIWHFEKDKKSYAIKVSGNMISDDVQSLVDAALAGCGVIMAADWLVSEEITAGRLVEILPEWNALGEDGIYALRASKQYGPAKVRAFSDWLEEKFSNVPWNIERQKPQ